MIWRREKYFLPSGFRTPDFPLHNLVAMPTKLSQCEMQPLKSLRMNALTALTEVYTGFSLGLGENHNVKAYGAVEVALYSL
jgi:hypothetical protein